MWSEGPDTRASSAETPDCHDVVAAIGGVVLAVDPNLVITEVSASITHVLGMQPSSLIGQHLRSVMDVPDLTSASWAHTGPGGPTTTCRARHADGSRRTLELSAIGPLGQGPCHLVAHDVTARAVAEAALRQAEERFRLAFDMAPTGNAIVLPGGRFMRVNSTMSDLLGVDEAELPGRRWTDFVSSRDRAKLDSFLEEVIAGSPDPHTVEVRLSQRSGRPVHAAVTATAVDDGTGRAGYVIAQLEDITARKLARAALQHQATHDALTTLPNRTMLLSHLQSAIDRRRDATGLIGLLFCDVDHFKRINDSLGHETGDLLLVEIAKRLRRAVRSTDVAGRLGGDEFLVICEDLRDQAQAERLAQRIRDIARDPVTVSDHSLQVQLSIGVAFASDQDDAGQLLRRADTAMYAAKAQGRGRVEIYDDALRDRARARLEIETDLRAAVAHDQLRLFHQPIVDLRDERVIGHEALVRWEHPRRGMLEPAEFIEVAEESDLIIDLGSWVLSAACKQGTTLQHSYAHSRMGLNVSARQLSQRDFRRRVEAALEASDLDPNLLVLELTETSLLHASATTLSDVQALADLGVSLAIDDFGTGYSSLTYLQKLPVRIVKIDRSFVAGLATDPKRQGITRAVIALGDALGLEIVAEGVETTDQATQLRDLGCTLAQGFLYGRPEPLDLTTH